MSTTIPVPPLNAPNTIGAPTTPADQAMGLAKDVPDLISKASVFAPDLAAKWTGKALLASKTFWGSIGVIVLTAVVKRYSLGWDANTVDVVVGAVDLGILSLLRQMSSVPITGIFRKATVAEAVAATKGAGA